MLRYLLFFWTGRILERLPMRLVYVIALLASEVGFLFNHSARRAVTANVRHALGPMASAKAVRRAVRGCFRANAFFYVDHVFEPYQDQSRLLDQHLSIQGIEHLMQATASGRGVILATLHYGNPIRVAQCADALGLRVLGVVEPLQPPELASLFRRYRARGGVELVEVSVSGMKRALQHLRGGGVLGIAVDLDIQGNGVEIPFCGSIARVPAGAASLALRTGAAIVPALTRRIGFDRYQLTIQPPVEYVRTGDTSPDGRELMTRVFQRFEPYLRRDPSQWFILEQSLWLDAPH